MAELSPLMRRLAQLERKYGKGATYSREQRDLITGHVIPEWVMRGELLVRGPIGERCTKAIKYLRELHGEVWPRVSDQDDLPQEHK